MSVMERLPRYETPLLILADQNMRFCQKVADRNYIIEKGTIQYHRAKWKTYWKMRR